ncbi:putative T7SS-secreted protein [Microbacterium sp. NPDC089320]|uniref:putative T7SS-secreted protein n=1 Tax=Microbacterium sp. NPDC089320 TaxID=3155182 RepID=UPI003435A172
MSELGMTTDPVALIPGSYAAAHTVASAWRSRSEACTALRDGLCSLEVDSAWAGYPYEKYLERAEYVRSSWQRCGEHLMNGAAALSAYGDALRWAQDEAARAIDLWEQAEAATIAARQAHRAKVRELERDLGVRHVELDVPFVDGGADLRAQAVDVLTNARGVLDRYAVEAATAIHAAADAAPLETPKQAESTKNRAVAGAVGSILFETAVLNPAIEQLNFIASMGNALINHPDILLELLGGAALIVGGGAMIGGGGAMIGGGGALALTGVGAAPGGGLAWAGVGVAGAGLAAAGHAGSRWMNEATGDDAVRVAERPPPHPEHGGRNVLGHWNGDGQRPWVDTEKIGLDQVARDIGPDVIRDKVRASIEGYHHKPDATADQIRYYDGFFENPDGTYTGIEVKGGNGVRDAAQRGFDNTVSPERPAIAMYNGKQIEITRVHLERVK